ncbi:hypothetical protein IC575_013931 [Cucumis melo]
MEYHPTIATRHFFHHLHFWGSHPPPANTQFLLSSFTFRLTIHFRYLLLRLTPHFLIVSELDHKSRQFRRLSQIWW